MNKLLRLPLIAALGLAPFLASAATPANAPVLKERGETAGEHDARMAWFREARFGMFVHWGLYSAFGGERDGKPAGGEYGEWIMFHARIPLAEYAAKAKTFNPTGYDAERWVLAAKGAGMKYIVITAKHHEGFAMFDSKADDYNIVKATPFKRDPLRELVAACRKHGMKIGFYYSQNLDWSHAGGGIRGKAWDPIQSGGDSDKYVDGLVIPQLRELLTNYGPIDILWFDIPGGVINKPRADRIQAAVLACNPKILINNRLGGGYHGDTETPEQFVPATGFPGRDWETCMTMNNTWGYKKRDHHWKSTTAIIRMFADIASKGGNFLLNVGPNELGEIPAPSLERMKAIGEWSAANAAAIYGTDASPFPRTFPWGRVTHRDNTIFLHVFDLPANRRLALAGLTTPVKSAKLLVAGTTLTVERDATGTPSVFVPEGVKLDPAVTVIAVELEGKPVVVAPQAPVQAPDAKGAYPLNADDAALTGSLQLNKGAIGHWTNAADTVTWRCRIDKPGAYTVKLEYACESASAGSEVRIAADGSLSADGKFIGATFTVKSTGGFDKYVVSESLDLDIAKTGPVVIELRAVKKPGRAVMNVRRVTLEPKR